MALLGIGAVAVLPLPSYARICADQDTEEAADECRAAALQQDAGKQEDYTRFEGRSVRLQSNVPVPAIDDEYSRATLALAAKFDDYFTIDPYDKRRTSLIKDLKTDSQAWVSTYARGGSVRKQSARRFYIAIDAVLGHLASNGLAPLPSRKASVVKATLAEARVLLADGK